MKPMGLFSELNSNETCSDCQGQAKMSLCTSMICIYEENM